MNNHAEIILKTIEEMIKNGHSMPSLSKISLACGIPHRSAIHKSVKSLIKGGLLKTVRVGRGMVYEVTHRPTEIKIYIKKEGEPLVQAYYPVKYRIFIDGKEYQGEATV